MIAKNQQNGVAQDIQGKVSKLLKSANRDKINIAKSFLPASTTPSQLPQEVREPLGHALEKGLLASTAVLKSCRPGKTRTDLQQAMHAADDALQAFKEAPSQQHWVKGHIDVVTALRAAKKYCTAAGKEPTKLREQVKAATNGLERARGVYSKWKANAVAAGNAQRRIVKLAKMAAEIAKQAKTPKTAEALKKEITSVKRIIKKASTQHSSANTNTSDVSAAVAKLVSIANKSGKKQIAKKLVKLKEDLTVSADKLALANNSLASTSVQCSLEHLMKMARKTLGRANDALELTPSGPAKGALMKTISTAKVALSKVSAEKTTDVSSLHNATKITKDASVKGIEALKMITNKNDMMHKVKLMEQLVKDEAALTATQKKCADSDASVQTARPDQTKVQRMIAQAKTAMDASKQSPDHALQSLESAQAALSAAKKIISKSKDPELKAMLTLLKDKMKVVADLKTKIKSVKQLHQNMATSTTPPSSLQVGQAEHLVNGTDDASRTTKGAEAMVGKLLTKADKLTRLAAISDPKTAKQMLLKTVQQTIKTAVRTTQATTATTTGSKKQTRKDSELQAVKQLYRYTKQVKGKEKKVLEELQDDSFKAIKNKTKPRKEVFKHVRRNMLKAIDMVSKSAALDSGKPKRDIEKYVKRMDEAFLKREVVKAEMANDTTGKSRRRLASASKVMEAVEKSLKTVASAAKKVCPTDFQAAKDKAEAARKSMSETDAKDALKVATHVIKKVRAISKLAAKDAKFASSSVKKAKKVKPKVGKGKRKPKLERFVYHRDDSVKPTTIFNASAPICKGTVDFGCIFHTLLQAKAFCDKASSCTAIIQRPNGNELGSFSPMQGIARAHPAWRLAGGKTYVKGKRVTVNVKVSIGDLALRRAEEAVDTVKGAVEILQKTPRSPEVKVDVSSSVMALKELRHSVSAGKMLTARLDASTKTKNRTAINAMKKDVIIAADNAANDALEAVRRTLKLVVDVRTSKAYEFKDALVDSTVKLLKIVARTGQSIVGTHPRLDVNVKGSNVAIVKNIAYQQACSELCQLNDRCVLWTWVSPKFNRLPRLRKECFLKARKMGQPLKMLMNADQKGLVSGAKGAKGEPTKVLDAHAKQAIDEKVAKTKEKI